MYILIRITNNLLRKTNGQRVIMFKILWTFTLISDFQSTRGRSILIDRRVLIILEGGGGILVHYQCPACCIIIAFVEVVIILLFSLSNVYKAPLNNICDNFNTVYACQFLIFLRLLQNFVCVGGGLLLHPLPLEKFEAVAKPGLHLVMQIFLCL